MNRIIWLALFATAALIVSLHSGPAPVSWSEIWNFFSGRDLSRENFFLLSVLRIPRTVAAFAVGAALGAAGLALQTLLKNPLAEPYTLGLSGGGALGAIAALYLGLEPSMFWIPFLSTAGCLSAAGLVIALGRGNLQFESRSLILFGVMISLFFGAVVVTALSVLSPVQLQSAMFWLLGQFGTSRDVWIYRIGPLLLLGIVMLSFKANSLDALSLGEARAFSLGYSPKKERIVLIILCTFLTSLSVSISGLVGFIGLVSPHLARRFVKTSRHKTLIAASALTGGGLLVLADSAGRSIGTQEIPAGSVAALIGAPVLISLLMRKQNAPVE